MTPTNVSGLLQLPPLRAALGEALFDNWGDLMPRSDLGLIHIEYELAAEGAIDSLSIWASSKWGYWNLIGEYSMHKSASGEIGLHFSTGYHSDRLSDSLEAIMQHQQMFTPPVNAQHGLIQVYPPGVSN